MTARPIPPAAPCGRTASGCRCAVHCPYCGDGWSLQDVTGVVLGDGDNYHAHCRECGGRFEITMHLTLEVVAEGVPPPVKPEGAEP